MKISPDKPCTFSQTGSNSSGGGFDRITTSGRLISVVLGLSFIPYGISNIRIISLPVSLTLETLAKYVLAKCDKFHPFIIRWIKTIEVYAKNNLFRKEITIHEKNFVHQT